VSKDEGRRQKTDLHGLSFRRRSWLKYKDGMSINNNKKKYEVKFSG
jgi:hypothetical protein